MKANNGFLAIGAKARLSQNPDVGLKMMKKIIVIIAILFSAGMCLAQGYGDYALDIGDGYRVVRCNGMDVAICKTDRNIVILSPSDYEKVGPLDQYITTPDFIFTRNLGRKPRNLHEGDTFEDVDPSQEYFFSITKGTDVVHGPFNQEEFSRLPEVMNLDKLYWKDPENHNPWWVYGFFIKGLIIFLVVAAIDSYWISIPFIVGVVLLIRYKRKKRKEKCPTRGPGCPPQGVGSPDP